MSGERVTARDVAAKAGVSQSAVSRVFTPGASVSRATIDKVRAAADALGYRPNALARSLITKHSRIIGVVVAYFDNQFYPYVLEELGKTLQEEGYHMLLFMASNDRASVDRVLEDLMGYQVEAIVAASVSLSSDMAQRCAAAGAPVVLFNRSQDTPNLSAVTSANLKGGEAMARHLVEGGHRRIAFLAGWEGASTQRDREAGFRRGLEAEGVALFAREVGDYNYEHAASAARKLLARDPRPDAVFAANDHMAFALIDVARSEFGLRVPEDLAVAGYDDAPPASWPCFDLTTVRQPIRRMAKAAKDLIMERVADPRAPARRIEIEGPLQIRGTTRRPERRS